MMLNIIFILSLVLGIHGQTNCSSYNLCGSHGYCVDQTDDQWYCECKFWWEGELCNRQSNNGKQVIALGCLVALLISIYFGLNIGRKFYKKKKNEKESEIKEAEQTPKLVSVTLDHVRRSAQLTSCLIGISMIIVAGIALLIKWSLLRKIHKVIVDQFNDHPDDPLYFNTTSFCDTLDLQDFNVFTFPFACLLFIICAIVTKRISLMKNRWHGYGAPPIPVDFLLHLDRKFAAVMFAITADELLRIVQDVISGSANKGQGVLGNYFYRLAQVLYMGLKYYPILAAVHINTIFILICATLYTWLLYSFAIVTEGMCHPNYYPSYTDYLDNSTDINDKLKYFGTGPAIIAIQLCTDIPQYLCFAYVSVKLAAILIEKNT